MKLKIGMNLYRKEHFSNNLLKYKITRETAKRVYATPIHGKNKYEIIFNKEQDREDFFYALGSTSNRFSRSTFYLSTPDLEQEYKKQMYIKYLESQNFSTFELKVLQDLYKVIKNSISEKEKENEES